MLFCIDLIVRYVWCFQAIYMLADMGADVNAQNQDDDTALHVMLRRERLDCAISLLVQGASANIVGSGGNNALHLAIEVRARVSGLRYWHQLTTLLS